MDWINIEEKIPPQNACVLVNVFDGRAKVRMSHVEIAYRLGSIWYEPNHGEELITKYVIVTHWMPLPDCVKIDN